MRLAVTRGVPEVGRGGDQQLPLDEGLRYAVACLPSSAEVVCGLVVRLPGATPQPRTGPALLSLGGGQRRTRAGVPRRDGQVPQRHGDHRTPRACRDDPDRFWEWTARLAPGAASREPATARRQRRQLDESEPDESEPRSAPAAPLPRPCGARGVPLVDCWISRRTSAYQR